MAGTRTGGESKEGVESGVARVCFVSIGVRGFVDGGLDEHEYVEPGNGKHRRRRHFGVAMEHGNAHEREGRVFGQQGQVYARAVQNTRGGAYVPLRYLACSHTPGRSLPAAGC